MAPAHQWAQSGDELFVSVKFAHKWDAPATLVGENDVESVEFAGGAGHGARAKRVEAF